jgi:hypothetical protein
MTVEHIEGMVAHCTWFVGNMRNDLSRQYGRYERRRYFI